MPAARTPAAPLPASRAAGARARWLPLLVACACAGPSGPEPAEPPLAAGAPRREVVVLLHGLARSRGSMAGIGRTLGREGFRVLNLGWPSRNAGLLEQVDRLAERLEAEGLATGADPAPVHFVTHSAGGILTRAFLAEHADFPVGRVVQLAPPNGGSRLAGVLERRSRLFEAAFGPLGPDLARVDLPPPTYELGVIAGDHSCLPTSRWIPGEDDGIVGVEETRAPGMADHLVVPRTHSLIMHSRVVQRQVLAFLRHGRFDDPGPPEGAVDESAGGDPSGDGRR